MTEHSHKCGKTGKQRVELASFMALWLKEDALRFWWKDVRSYSTLKNLGSYAFPFYLVEQMYKGNATQLLRPTTK